MTAINTDKFEKFLSSVHKTSTIQDLRVLGRTVFRRHGLKIVGYRHIPPKGAKAQTPKSLISVIGMRAEWVKYFCDRRYYTLTKFVRSAMYSTKPRKWSEFADLPDMDGREREMMEAFSRFNPGRGIVIPVFGPHDRNGIFTIGFGNRDEPPAGITIPELQFLCQVLHHRLCTIVQKEIFSVIKLSNREKEVLGLIAAGDSTPEIAASMGIKANTVNTYVRRIFEKLNVTNRGTAIVRAAAFGFL